MTFSIEERTALIQDPDFKAELLRQFAPTFCFSAQEKHFPEAPQKYIKEVILAKFDWFFTRAQQAKGPETQLALFQTLQPLVQRTTIDKTCLDNIRNQLSHASWLEQFKDEELHQLLLICKYFINENENENENEQEEISFNDDYKEQYQADAGFQEFAKEHDDYLKAVYDKFLVFDEEAAGFKLGEKIPLGGYNPANSHQESPPVQINIVATEKGYRIQFEYFYPLNTAIYGFEWLRKILPKTLSTKVFDNFGLHYGDSEGVDCYIEEQKDGSYELRYVQAYAHGRKGSGLIDAKDCSFDKDGHPLVYVGLGSHASYMTKFEGRNKFLDIVGDHARLRPTEFSDVTTHSTGFARHGDSNPIQRDKDGLSRTEPDPAYNNYRPSRFLAFIGHYLEKAWNFVAGKQALHTSFSYNEAKKRDILTKDIVIGTNSSYAKACIPLYESTTSNTSIPEEEKEAADQEAEHATSSDQSLEDSKSSEYIKNF